VPSGLTLAPWMVAPKVAERSGFSVAVANKHNHGIVDLENAVNLKHGEVERWSNFVVVRPKDAARGNGTMLLEVLWKYRNHSRSAHADQGTGPVGDRIGAHGRPDTVRQHDCGASIDRERPRMEGNNKLPYRMALADGWMDQPFVSKLNPRPPGSMGVVGLEPYFRFMDQAGMRPENRNCASRTGAVSCREIPNRRSAPRKAQCATRPPAALPPSSS